MSGTLRRFWIQLTADRKRFGMLCACLGLGLLLWARLIVVSHPPRTAIADDAAASAAESGAGTDKSKSSSSGTLSGPRANRVPIPVQLDSIPSHDPFVISTVYFPKLTPFADLPKEASKLPPEPVEEPQQIEARITAQLLAIAERFKLEAAVAGSMAVIDGKNYRLADSVRGNGSEPVVFTLAEIRQRSVVLECQGRRFELHMESPGS